LTRIKLRKPFLKKLLIGSLILSAFLMIAFPGQNASCNKNSKNYPTGPYHPGFGIWIPNDYEVHGIDVSRHQREINWESVSETNYDNVTVSFAFIKASEGKSIKDPYFAYNWKESKKNNILRGAYHFFRSHLTAEEQFAIFKSQVKLDKEDLPPVLDVEVKGSCPPARMAKNIKKWLVLAEKHYGVTPILYTNWHFYKTYLRGKEFKKYPLWIAHYVTPDINEKISDWEFWQHNENARVNGIRGGVDFNVYKGSYNDLLQLCKR